jgi:hypothetical protein
MQRSWEVSIWGGSNLLRMSDIRERLEALRFREVSSYKQSGNLLFEAQEIDAVAIREKIQREDPERASRTARDEHRGVLADLARSEGYHEARSLRRCWN